LGAVAKVQKEGGQKEGGNKEGGNKEGVKALVVRARGLGWWAVGVGRGAMVG
jgi:hypothetical protein